MEAAAMELPIVVSDLPGVVPLVEQGVTGYIAPIGDSARLASLVLEIVASPDRAREMGKAGRQLTEARFDEHKVFQRVNEIYRALFS